MGCKQIKWSANALVDGGGGGALPHLTTCFAFQVESRITGFNYNQTVPLRHTIPFEQDEPKWRRQLTFFQRKEGIILEEYSDCCSRLVVA